MMRRELREAGEERMERRKISESISRTEIKAAVANCIHCCCHRPIRMEYIVGGGRLEGGTNLLLPPLAPPPPLGWNLFVFFSSQN